MHPRCQLCQYGNWGHSSSPPCFCTCQNEELACKLSAQRAARRSALTGRCGSPRRAERLSRASGREPPPSSAGKVRPRLGQTQEPGRAGPGRLPTPRGRWPGAGRGHLPPAEPAAPRLSPRGRPGAAAAAAAPWRWPSSTPRWAGRGAARGGTGPPWQGRRLRGSGGALSRARWGGDGRPVRGRGRGGRAARATPGSQGCAWGFCAFWGCGGGAVKRCAACLTDRVGGSGPAGRGRVSCTGQRSWSTSEGLRNPRAAWEDTSFLREILLFLRLWVFRWRSLMRQPSDQAILKFQSACPAAQSRSARFLLREYWVRLAELGTKPKVLPP